MFHISNLRTESSNGWTKLIADIEQKGWGYDFLPEHTLWIAVKDEDAHMLADDVYDAFLLVPLYLGMFYKQYVYIHGCVSKKLYNNVMNYLQAILCSFSDDLSRIKIHVDGFKEADGNQNIIGAGLSCGVDSLSTIYDRYVLEDDPDNKINALFFFNCGWHGDYYNERTMKLCMDRYNTNKPCADELGLPLHLVDSNFHAFFYKMYAHSTPVGHMGYLSNYSCILGLGRAIKKYYVASGHSYLQTISSALTAHDDDFSDFSESYSIPLIQTERLELIVDGCQYARTQKMERIADWEITQKYLNPCNTESTTTESAHNCSKCNKCLRTLIAIEAMNKLNDFAEIFDIETYKKHSFGYKCEVVLNRDRRDRSRFVYHHDNYNFAKAHGMQFPSKFTAYMYFLKFRIKSTFRRIVDIISGRAYRNRLYK